MPLPDRAGRFHAIATEIGVDETGPNSLATATILYRISEELCSDGKWYDVSAEALEITGYHYLEKTDGALNERTITDLKAAFGWDGADPFWLEDNAEALRQRPVQIVLGFEEYDGRRRIRVQWLNPYGSSGSGGVSHADAAKRQAMTNKLGSQFRALSGAAVPAPSPTGRPTLPAKAPPAVTPPTPVSPAGRPDESSLDDAWAAYSSAAPAEWDQQTREANWFQLLGETIPGKQPNDFTPAEWAAVIARVCDESVPF